MEIGKWYSFEEDEDDEDEDDFSSGHTFGYTLFYPLEKKRFYYGMCIICNDAGPNHGSVPAAWNHAFFGNLEEKLVKISDEYNDINGKQPPTPIKLISQVFAGECDFVKILQKEDRWVN